MIFKVEQKDSQSKARAGRVRTDHGEIETPNFYASRYRCYGERGTSKGIKK